MKTKFDQLDKTLHSLKTIAGKYKEDSIEYKSIELSAKALIYFYTEGYLDGFEKYVEGFNKDLTDDQKAFLKKNGIK